MPPPPATGADDAALERFARDGWFAVPRFLDAAWCDRLIADTDRWVAGDATAPIAKDARGERIQLSLPAVGGLVVHPPLLALVERLLGPGFHYHHVHCSRQNPGDPGVHWHQDYEQLPQLERSHRMAHAFLYPRGLDGTVGDLLLRPGSHAMVIANDAFAAFGTADLPGSIVIDDLPPGSLVVIHSALLHARRAKPGGDAPRYLIDVSYCQAGIRWPSNYGCWRDKLAVGRERLDPDGRRAHLFDERAFFDVEDARRRLAQRRGSLIGD